MRLVLKFSDHLLTNLTTEGVSSPKYGPMEIEVFIYVYTLMRRVREIKGKLTVGIKEALAHQASPEGVVQGCNKLHIFCDNEAVIKTLLKPDAHVGHAMSIENCKRIRRFFTEPDVWWLYQ